MNVCVGNRGIFSFRVVAVASRCNEKVIIGSCLQSWETDCVPYVVDAGYRYQEEHTTTLAYKSY